jgi:choline dehydrogenase
MADEIVVVGAGSAGCVLAARLTEHASRGVLLLEAGPDYPAATDLPAEIAEARMVAETHDWGYSSEPDARGRSIGLPRGRIVGGCSAVNATFALRGFPSDYDGWAAAGNDGWSFDEVLPSFCRGETDLDFGDAPWHGSDGPLPIRRYPSDERSALTEAFLAAAAAVGHPRVDDHNQPGEVGVGPTPVNARDGVRMSTALTHLAGARGRPNLGIRAGAVVDRVEIRRGKAVGVRLVGGELVESDTVVLAAGAYGSPAILLRSGIGDGDELRSLGLDVIASLPGVGRNLVDHPRNSLDLPLGVGVGDHACFQSLLTARSERADPADPCDLHVAAAGPFGVPEAGSSVGVLMFSVMKPKSRGVLRLRSADPLDAPRIWLAHLEDADDRARMIEALRLARRIARKDPIAGLVIGPELGPAPGIADDDAAGLGAALLATTESYHHPVGTCAMGTDPDARAVVDPRGHVHGIDGLIVADASVMPEIPAANTNLPAIMIAERVAEFMAGA